MNERPGFEVHRLRRVSDSHRRAEHHGGWLQSVEVFTDGPEPVQTRTPSDCEGCVIVLSGTHDLQAGAGSWAARGLRPRVYEGRPVALFLPPNTPFAASGGRGELLLVAVRRPPATTPANTASDAVTRPLLPLAGSNKVYDGDRGSWQPIETMPDSPEAILPRRIERISIGACTIERIFPLSYKTRALCLDEAQLAPHAALALPDYDAAGYPAERSVYYRAEQPLTMRDGNGDVTLAGEGLLTGIDGVTFVAGRGSVYLLVIAAGPKPRA